MVVDPDIWKRFMADEDITADCLSPATESLDMASTKASNSKPGEEVWNGDDELEAVS
jgi:hypothetical protein